MMLEDNFPSRVWDYPDQIDWIFTGEWELLDNFALTPVMMPNGVLYPTTEHAFAAAKAKHDSDHDWIADMPTPGAAKAAGRSVALRDDWEQVKFDVMWQALIAKFYSHKKFEDKLAATGERVIVEGNAWDDRVWGATLDSRKKLRGRNALGVMLMQLRFMC